MQLWPVALGCVRQPVQAAEGHLSGWRLTEVSFPVGMESAGLEQGAQTGPRESGGLGGIWGHTGAAEASRDPGAPHSFLLSQLGSEAKARGKDANSKDFRSLHTCTAQAGRPNPGAGQRAAVSCSPPEQHNGSDPDQHLKVCFLIL